MHSCNKDCQTVFEALVASVSASRPSWQYECQAHIALALELQLRMKPTPETAFSQKPVGFTVQESSVSNSHLLVLLLLQALNDTKGGIASYLNDVQ